MAPREVPGAGPPGRAQEVGRLQAPLGGQVRHGRGPRRRMGRRLVLRRRADLRAEEVRCHPPGLDHARRQGEHRVRPDPDDHDGHYVRRHAQGVLGPRRAGQGPGPQLHRRLAAVPDLPPLLRPDVLRGQGQGAGPGLRQGQQRLDGRGVVRAVGRREHPALPHPAVGRRAGGGRDQAQRRAGVRAIAFSEIPTRLELPSINTGTGTRCGRSATTTASPCACTSVRRHQSDRLPRLATPPSAAPSGSTTPWRRWPTGCSRATCSGSPS